MTLGGFGGVAGFFALFFFSDIPRVRKDIWQKVPVLGQHYVKEVPASDNVGLYFLRVRVGFTMWEKALGDGVT
jgi:Ubiquinol-cytochrome-c reductase complex subunit (QCR10)